MKEHHRVDLSPVFPVTFGVGICILAVVWLFFTLINARFDAIDGRLDVIEHTISRIEDELATQRAGR